MKIIYCVTVRLPTEKAHGLQIMKTNAALVQSGAKVELVIPDRTNPITVDPFVFYGVEKTFSITKLKCPDLITNNRLGLVGYWLQSYLFVRAIRRHCDFKNIILYTRDLPLAFWFTKINAPLFYEIHSLPKNITFVHRRAWRKARGIIVISDGLRAELIAAGMASEKIIVVRDSVDVAQFQNVPSKNDCRDQLGIPLDQKVAVYTGHLYGWKGADTLARAGKLLAGENIHTYVVGGTDAEIVTFRAEFSSRFVHVIGRRDHNEMPRWLAAADVLVIPNSAKYKIGAVYTSPLKLFEYMAAGRPIVATAVPALREVLGENAIFAEADNPDSIAAAIQKTFDNYSVLENQAKKIAETVATKYSWERRGELIINFMKQHV
ncbi:MAG: hypothetical protein A2821_03000 [Candidatus Magasanikbacteria bacterium RIFCSPHIGHO2_01_FULL_41_23]|uniref:Glycosyltransferase subfamily 4-like N-terminal domain-containing protein n=1 Tax=Candidatus Magasanikbacteria bacterium RIFCSPLOWO2_01_FULL_40_15 TaxID=1798686 RepID=A0A1F6N496_9BACT|nr:MAG: hypothetical protein A2821_03000 [Candidatus Magasanikbacteria bacterium RIFCSPHIGHO2_01_FULL_41_23]OGH67306.1 MAG: hypothetical protein A3C66_01015 [Candidatus Magasanikbacteria bacterium RIFCSPHIGHO2_02_FULL_41_35]OGH76531.1 MAG: hypothetical protein A3F22_00225 [Candidatus Magasanikbacteria bacterium RIFCSPHIGHO2_12_FULL_41_16]OGH78483.1 MAG: hypothetical protein A2983_03130 [Candidatus Magasanikbacteria bacterium RIFCSPLOWO2_01_FULL_40_15]